MAENSVDDMYFGCEKKMMKKIEKKYLKEEKKRFKKAWDEAEKCAVEKFKHREDKALTKNHMRAICIYTGDKVYESFNEAVREGRSIYTSNKFQFHSLHFLLTSAVKMLNSNNGCYTTYRKTKVRFAGKVNQIIRFGSFASSSKKATLKSFGHETCFQIKTCLGGDLKNYSKYKEAEVLIPPYEMFKITNIMNRSKIPGLEDCEVVFVLENVGGRSILNCKLISP